MRARKVYAAHPRGWPRRGRSRVAPHPLGCGAGALRPKPAGLCPVGLWGLEDVAREVFVFNDVAEVGVNVFGVDGDAAAWVIWGLKGDGVEQLLH